MPSGWSDNAEPLSTAWDILPFVSMLTIAGPTFLAISPNDLPGCSGCAEMLRAPNERAVNTKSITNVFCLFICGNLRANIGGSPENRYIVNKYLSRLYQNGGCVLFSPAELRR